MRVPIAVNELILRLVLSAKHHPAGGVVESVVGEGEGVRVGLRRKAANYDILFGVENTLLDRVCELTDMTM